MILPGQLGGTVGRCQNLAHFFVSHFLYTDGRILYATIMTHSLKERLATSFRWFGFGALFLMVTLFGSVSASEPTVFREWRVIFLATGLVGSLCILFGLIILALNMHHLWRGGEYDR